MRTATVSLHRNVTLHFNSAFEVVTLEDHLRSVMQAERDMDAFAKREIPWMPPLEEYNKLRWLLGVL